MDALGPAELRAPEARGKWSVLQVLRHLADSEIVFGFRIRMVLAQDRPVLTGYDQDRWAGRLCYEDADPAMSLLLFSTVRGANLRLLHRDSTADLRGTAVHAERGEETREHMIRLYAGHHLVHLRQIERIRERQWSG